MVEDKTTAPGLYSDAEVQAGVKELFSHAKFVAGMQAFLPAELADMILAASREIDNSFDFQERIVRPLLQHLKRVSLKSLTCSGLEHLDPKKKYLFISNHRDIGLDSAFLNLMLFDHKFTTTQIAIGDNLCKHRIAELIFRINKSFLVQRSGGAREMYQASKDLSAYIRDTISSESDSVWIAQREGRAKDGNDQTQISLLKMLTMSKETGDLVDHFKQLNIVPATLSYEYNPCDFYLVKEYLDRMADPNYSKSFEDDMASILQGLKGQKGQVHVAFGKPLTFDEEISELAQKPMLKAMADQIDKQIHANYNLCPINYFAHDGLHRNESILINIRMQKNWRWKNTLQAGLRDFQRSCRMRRGNIY